MIRSIDPCQGNNTTQQVFVDPVSPVSLVAAEREWPSDSFAIFVEEAFVRRDKQFVEHGRFVRLARRQMEAEWKAVAVAEYVDLRGKTPSRTA